MHVVPNFLNRRLIICTLTCKLIDNIVTVTTDISLVLNNFITSYSP